MKDFKLNTTHLNKLDKKFYSICSATPLKNPSILLMNYTLLEKLGLHHTVLGSDAFLDFLNGSYTASGSILHANAYSGHQFGYFTPNLGDGRALNLGYISGFHLQLKGSGKTKYSRDGDGRAILSSSIREYLMSEAMHGLGISTTRALALTSSTTKVYRQEIERGAMLLRASPSWIRFGTFEFAYLGAEKVKHVKMLADYVIDESYPHLKEISNKYEKLYFAIVDATLEMIVSWQSIGFMHGVMNTDNMSIAGLTIDYGPFAFMENFEKGFICNTSDYEGRYSFEAQPFIAQWNLSALLHPFSIIAEKNVMQNYLDKFMQRYKLKYYELIAKKLGLDKTIQEDKNLISELLEALENDKVDYTNFFYRLSTTNFEVLSHLGSHIKEWISNYKNRLLLETISIESRLESMRKINPKYVLKNYMIQEAIDEVQKGEFELLKVLLKIAQNPYAEHKEYERYSYASKPNSTLKCGCSS